MIESPLYCLTADVDWASDHCIRDLVAVAHDYGIEPTVFATHKSIAIAELMTAGQIEVGIHPNFSPAIAGEHSRVIDELLSAYPDAKTFRSHSFFDSTTIVREMLRRGIVYDSNLSLYLHSSSTVSRGVNFGSRC